jgi:pimeloyl-ACP methyl ester carboxylesterase
VLALLASVLCYSRAIHAPYKPHKKHETRHNHDIVRGWSVMSREPALESPGDAQTPKPRHNATSSTLRKRLGTLGRWLARVVLVVAFLLGVVTTLIPQGRGAFRAAMLLPALVFRTQPLPLTFTGDDVRHTSLTVPSKGGPVYLDVYEPAAPTPPIPGAREGVVIIPGVDDNRQDQQLINLVEGMARVGIVAMLMTTDTLIGCALLPKDADAVSQAVLRLQSWPGVGANRVGIVGFSAGGALASLAAAEPQMQGHIAFLTFFGGFFNAESLLQDVGRRALVVDGKTQPWNPDPIPLRVLANTISTTLPTQEANLLTGSCSEGFSPLSDGQVAQLTPSTQAAYHLLAGDQPDQAAANVAALSPEMHTLLAALSPSSVVQDINAPIYLLHDRSDIFVPFTESRDFNTALDRLGKPHQFVEFSIFQHVEVKSGLGLGPLLGDGLRLYRVVYSLLEPSI